MRLMRSGGWLPNTAFASAAIACLWSAPLHAGNPSGCDVAARTGSPILAGNGASERGAICGLIEHEAANTDLPADVVEAVVFVESGFDPNLVGSVGEIGLMQVRPETAAMLGFRGTRAELAQPAINIHYGVLYLLRAWQLAGGDLCRALTKYRAGHREEIMTPRSQIYCSRARARLLAVHSSWGSREAVARIEPARATAQARLITPAPARPTDVYAIYRQGTPAASRAYWAAHEAKVRLIKVQIEAKWKRIASG